MKLAILRWTKRFSHQSAMYFRFYETSATPLHKTLFYVFMFQREQSNHLQHGKRRQTQLPLRSTATYELNRHSFTHLFDGFAQLRGLSELSWLADMNPSASSSFAVVLASKRPNSCLVLLILLSCLTVLNWLIAFYILLDEVNLC